MTALARSLPVIVLSAALCGCAAGIRSAAPESVPSQHIAERPQWLEEGIVMVGNWEPLSFLRRRGGASMEDLETWSAERTEQAARKLKEAGVNLVITNLHKGAGLQAEAADIEATRQFTRHAHALGMRVGGYIGSSLFYETFTAEEPASREWIKVNEWGQPIYYNNGQTFRYMACRNNPGYQAFVQKVLHLGVKDLGLDLIHFDQMEGKQEPQSCRCRYCQEQFREFLRARYTDAQLDERYGFRNLAGVIPPPYMNPGSIALPELVNPLMQDWAYFRAASYARRYGEYDNYIHRLNPQVALEGNPNLNFGWNKGFLQAVDIGQLLDHGDIVWSEEPNHASWTADGRLISKIRSFKAARIMGNSLFVYTGGRYGAQGAGSPPELRLAEAMAYNDMNLGMVGDVRPDGVSVTPEARRYIDFFKAHAKDLSGTTSLAEVAVLRSFASIEFNPAVANVATVLFEQTLLQSKIPFDILFDRHLSDLSRYKALVLADQDALGDAQIRAIRDFVEKGGGLVATGTTSMLTDWRLRRRKFGLAELFGMDQPSGNAVRRSFGKGRVVYLPRVEPSIAPPPPRMDYNFSNQYWALPKNYRDLAAAVEWAVGTRPAVKVSAPLSVTVEFAGQKSTNTLLLHLVNFESRKRLANLAAEVRIPEGRSLREITIASPDGGEPRTLAATVREGVASFRIPALQVYNLVQLRLQ